MEMSSFWRTFHHWLHRKLTTFGAANDEYFIKMTTFSPAGTRRNSNVFITSKRRRRRRFDVLKTLSLRHYYVMCPLGRFGVYSGSNVTWYCVHYDKENLTTLVRLELVLNPAFVRGMSFKRVPMLTPCSHTLTSLLTHCGLVTPYNDIYLGQHRLR